MGGRRIRGLKATVKVFKLGSPVLLDVRSPEKAGTQQDGSSRNESCLEF